MPPEESIKWLQRIVILARRILIPAKEDELLRWFAEGIIDVFTGCYCCIRLVDPHRGVIKNAYAIGILDSKKRDYLFVSPDCFEEGEIPFEVRKTLPAGIAVVDSSECIFRDGVHCAVVALYLGQHLHGFLHLERSGGTTFDPTERMFLFAAGGIFTAALATTFQRKELDYMRDYMEKLVEHTDVPIIVLDSDRRIKTFNRAMEQITGYSKEEVRKSEFFGLIKEQDRGRIATAVSGALQGRSIAGFEVHIPRRDSRDSVPLALNMAPVSDPQGETTEVVLIGQDLTEVKRLQNQMLHSERLATIGQLAAGVVHEINNPLTSISVYSEYLLRKGEQLGFAEGDLNRLRKIVSAADRILKFTKELMSYARPAPEEPTLVDLREIANHAVGFCEHIIARCAVTVRREFPETLPPVYGVKGQLQQVLVNLITNACQAMKEMGGEITIRIVDNEDGSIRVEVADAGMGMPKDVLEKAFEPFFTTKAEGEGTGLGLSIVKNIIQNHHGDIRIQSEIGRGTTVIFTLFSFE